ncbi:retrotransposon protein, putative, ty1-copia subclass [Tanacetum coccineum]
MLYRQLRLVLSTEDKEQYLEQPIPTAPVVVAPDQPIPPAALTTYNEWVKNQKEIVVMMLLTMGPRKSKRICLSWRQWTCLKSYKALTLTSRTDPSDYERIPHMQAGGRSKNKNKKPSKAAKGVQGKGKGKKAYANAEPSYAPKPKNPPPPKKDNPAKDAICHHCSEVGHWRRNCPTYLAELLKKKQLSQGASTSCIFTIELYSFPSTFWVYDTCCAVKAIRNYHLCLPSGLVIILNNCHYAPSITRGIILVSRLYEDGFINRFELNNAISVSKNNVVYFSAILRDGVYEIEMSCSNTNDSSIKKRIEKLQHERLLNSTNIQSLRKCVSCMSGKMARKPYSHQVERAKDLLGLIHTDVCGPFKIMSRQGASYFVTFTDDFSRYGYVYLLKHKHEVFETFKVFQKEVENQLGKTIKSLRSDRGGEYMSQEFLDHLKEHGIIAHRTPPYTPQNNGVSERRNRTLLDMVRSMMSQTTLPKSFWDYALETVARILNMVPTKKVDKTPYEIWHGQAPKLSYLKVWGCEALVKRDTLTKPDKLDPRSFRCIFVGYPKETMGYSFYSPSENKVFVARNAEFFENDLIDLKASGSVEDLEIIQEEDTNPSVDTSLNHEEDDQEIDEPQSDINPIRRSTRTRRPTDRLCLYIDAEEHELGDLGEPANYKAALLDPESKKWLDAMNVEMQSMKDQ